LTEEVAMETNMAALRRLVTILVMCTCCPLTFAYDEAAKRAGHDLLPENFPPNFAIGAGTAAYQIEGAWNVDGKLLLLLLLLLVVVVVVVVMVVVVVVVVLIVVAVFLLFCLLLPLLLFFLISIKLFNNIIRDLKYVLLRLRSSIDRASTYGSESPRFESWARHSGAPIEATV
jgi:hypothetical protein